MTGFEDMGSEYSLWRECKFYNKSLFCFQGEQKPLGVEFPVCLGSARCFSRSSVSIPYGRAHRQVIPSKTSPSWDMGSS